MGLKCHDLLRLASPLALEGADASPWVAASLAETPWVVVRRGGEAGGRVAVGVRGATRAERFAAIVRAEDVVEAVTPADLAGRAPPRPHPAFDALASLRPALEATGASWGPAGAAGFELAASRATLTTSSDLDLVLRVTRRPERRTLDRLAAEADRAPLRVDVLLELAEGAVSLDEYLGGSVDVLLRTREGPRLVARDELAPLC
ncbi:malonate decarboxylase holo-ACP synthase [Methylopila henanensis]|uniref:Malonate decarboxylase holo-ACP synthase n=1 Tax=Methylopila henanensis TaxID=873516 RepID=A0ABW4K8U2_9HYPH